QDAMRTLPLLAVALTTAACTVTTYEQGPARPAPPPGPPPPAISARAAPRTPRVRVVRAVRTPNIAKPRADQARGSCCATEEVAQTGGAKYDCSPEQPVRRGMPLNCRAVLGATGLTTGSTGAMPGLPGGLGGLIPGGPGGLGPTGNNGGLPFPLP